MFFALIFTCFVLPSLWSQEAPAKYALVIGNGAYTGLSRLANPVNDAEDIAGVLEGLGFAVDKVLNGSLEQMEEAVIRLKNRLSVSGDSGVSAYGFFFYAGHGVQSNGENFLIPVDAYIPGENFLKNRAVSVQLVLDELNDARNSLNVVVLDACRDNPFSWGRSGSRGLATVSGQPARSIIVYATSAGQQASDGQGGRNGLFTGQLINNLADQSLDVNEVFRRTGAEVSEVSNNRQIPAVYNQFFGIAYLGNAPHADTPVRAPSKPQPVPPAGTERTKKDRPGGPDTQLWTAGASIGTSFVYPWVIATVRGTVAPFRYSFLDIGVDFGFVSGASDVRYFSFCPFAHAAYFRPFTAKIGAYAGAGGGYMTEKFGFSNGDHSEHGFVADFVTGINLLSMIDISYTLRTNFENISNKFAVGYTYRF